MTAREGVQSLHPNKAYGISHFDMIPHEMFLAEATLHKLPLVFFLCYRENQRQHFLGPFSSSMARSVL